nr:hypothetical protein CFP56_20865 [Quercus suber]
MSAHTWNFRQHTPLHMSQLTHVVQLSTAGVYSLEQLIHFLVTHLLSQIGQNVPKLTHTDETGELFVKHLEAAAIFLGLAGVAEAAGAVEDFLEGIEVDCDREVVWSASALHDLDSIWPTREWMHMTNTPTVSAHLSLEIADLCHSRVLATCAQQVAQAIKLDASGAALVEERERLLEVGALCLFRHEDVFGQPSEEVIFLVFVIVSAGPRRCSNEGRRTWSFLKRTSVLLGQPTRGYSETRKTRPAVCRVL